MKRKGFTLIELLAVIVVLAIISLIAVPIILNIIEKARIGSLKDSAYGIIETADLYFAQNSLTGNAINMTFEVEEGKKGLYIKGTETKLNYKGDQLESGSEVLITSKGKVGIKLIFKDYCVVKTTEETEVNLYESDCLMNLNVGENESVLSTELAEISALAGSETLSTSSTNISGAINELNEKVGTYDGEINSLSDSVISTNSNIATLNGNLSALSGTVNTLDENISTMDGEVDTLAAKVNSSSTYSYTERFTGNYWVNGKKIYAKTINFGFLANTGNKSVAHGISNVETIWIDMQNSYVLSDTGVTFPVTMGSPSVASSWYSYANATYIYNVCGVNRTPYSSVMTVLYTKTTN